MNIFSALGNKKPNDFDSTNEYVDQFKKETKVKDSSLISGEEKLDTFVSSDFKEEVAKQELVANQIAGKLKSVRK